MKRFIPILLLLTSFLGCRGINSNLYRSEQVFYAPAVEEFRLKSEGEQKKILSLLVNRLKSESSEKRTSALIALGNIGPGAKGCVPEIIRWWHESESRAYLDAILLIGPEAKESVPFLISKANGGDRYAADILYSWHAVKPLGEIYYDYKSYHSEYAVQPIVDMLKMIGPEGQAELWLMTTYCGLPPRAGSGPSMGYKPG